MTSPVEDYLQQVLTSLPCLPLILIHFDRAAINLMANHCLMETSTASGVVQYSMYEWYSTLLYSLLSLKCCR